jgi:uncharacterized protein
MGYFKLEQKGTQWHFNLHAGNHEPILRSEMYESKAAALNGIESVKKNSVRDGAFDLKLAKNGQYHFVLKSTNGQVVGQSEMYVAEASAKNGIASVTKNAPEAETKEA